MNFQEINIGQTHIRLTTDIKKHNLEKYIFNIRRQLTEHINRNREFELSLEPLKYDSENKSEIVLKMYEASSIAGLGPMACVAGTISEISLNYLIEHNSKYSIVENGGDIAIINDTSVVCGIYSNNNILGNNIGFKLKPRKNPLGICTSSGKIGHSISFGKSDSVTVIAKKASVADGLATRIANEVKGNTSEDKVYNAVEFAENFKEYIESVLIICDEHVGSVGRLPKIVETEEYKVKI